jgi:hypothetical protein
MRKYLAPAIADGIELGGKPQSVEQWGRVDRRVVPELSDPAARAIT